MKRFKNNLPSHKQNIDKTRPIVLDDKEPQSLNFKIASIYPWMNGVDLKHIHFINMLKNPNDFAGKIYEVICTIWPKVYQSSVDIFKKGGTKQLRHCHIVIPNKKDPRKINRLNTIFRTLYKRPLELGPKSHWWQVGVRGSIRIFGVYEGKPHNVFYPLICDWYHLISPNPKYNGIDLRNLSFNPKQLDGKYQIYRKI